MRVIGSGDPERARGFVRSDLYRGFQEQLAQTPQYLPVSYTYNCVGAYIIALGSLSSFSGAERLLNRLTHAGKMSDQEYLKAMGNAIIAFTELVGEDRKRERASAPVRRAKAFMKDHLFETVDMEELAAYCGCSLSHLRHRFKEETGISMVQYMRKKKIELAKQMLADTDYPIAKISSQLGFCAESYFITVFRQETGMTPRRFREGLG